MAGAATCTSISTPPALRDEAFDLYLCGPPPMVEAVRQWLRERSLEHLRLYLEKFTESGD
ncbi:anthranilate dioxygenase reductase [Pseudomonas aeruginosa]|nr:anthranilate dioxygenase reductase [Pseudomonas aeruginosa]